MLVWGVVRSIGRAGVFTSLLLLVFYSYGHVSELIDKLLFIKVPGTSVVIGPDKILLPLAVVGLIWVFIKTWKSKSSWAKFGSVLNIVGVVLVGMQIASVWGREVKISGLANESKTMVAGEETGLVDPDIYYIVLDSYAREDKLEEIFGWDNGEFVEGVEDLGFEVADRATSNYAHTFLSLPSTLNMEYVDFLADELGAESYDLRPAFELLHENKVIEFLSQRGYEVINFASGWGPTDNLRSADVNYRNGETFEIFGRSLALNEFYLVFLQTTAVSPFVQDALAGQSRDNVLYTFDKLSELPFRRGKKLVIAHLNVPHPPYLFDEFGNAKEEVELELSGDVYSDKDGYLGQLKFVSKRTLDLMEKLIVRSDIPPVIILQSDHGSATLLGHPGDWERPYRDEEIEERMSILYAIYADKLQGQIEPDETPVNVFRMIFSNYFGADLDKLPRKNYFTDNEGFYNFIDVTERVGD